VHVAKDSFRAMLKQGKVDVLSKVSHGIVYKCLLTDPQSLA